MKKLVAVLAVTFSRSPSRRKPWRQGSLEDALAAAKAAGKPLLIDFFAETG